MRNRNKYKYTYIYTCINNNAAVCRYMRNSMYSRAVGYQYHSMEGV